MRHVIDTESISANVLKSAAQKMRADFLVLLEMKEADI